MNNPIIAFEASYKNNIIIGTASTSQNVILEVLTNREEDNKGYFKPLKPFKEILKYAGIFEAGPEFDPFLGEFPD